MRSSRFVCGDSIRTECCGVFGVWAPGQPVAELSRIALLALQHRGQEGAGIAVMEQHHLRAHNGEGLVGEVFAHDALPASGQCALGHVLYTEKGRKQTFYPMPMSLEYGQPMCISLNGKLTNYPALRQAAERRGVKLVTSSDAELILHTIESEPFPRLENRILSALEKLEGAFSFLIMADEALFAIRDRYARKPMCYGALGDGQFAVASESCALDAVKASNATDVLPGEMLVIDDAGVRHIPYADSGRTRSCAFEYIYFARPDSLIDGRNVWNTRFRMGKQLALECTFDADIVVPVPSSGMAAAMGYSKQSGIPLQEGLIKNQYISRTFILPHQEQRQHAVCRKINPIRENLEGKRIVLVDDSIVRGTTMRHLTAMLRQCNAKKVFLCISSPPIVNVCDYGVDITSQEELIAVRCSREALQRNLNCDGLHFLSKEGLLTALDDQKQTSTCMGCFTANK